MLGDNYLMVDEIEFTPSSFGYELQAIETVIQTEAGTELANIQRLDKHVFNASWDGITSNLLAQIEDMVTKPTVILKYRDTEYVCRARGAAPSLLNKTYKYKRSDGLWNVAVTFTEL